MMFTTRYRDVIKIFFTAGRGTDLFTGDIFCSVQLKKLERSDEDCIEFDADVCYQVSPNFRDVITLHFTGQLYFRELSRGSKTVQKYRS